LCGAFPVRVGKGAKGEPEFRFQLMDKKEERVYRLIQTVVRRVREEGPGAHKTAKAASKESTPKK
jgi:hypothetical protein